MAGRQQDVLLSCDLQPYRPVAASSPSGFMAISLALIDAVEITENRLRHAPPCLKLTKTTGVSIDQSPRSSGIGAGGASVVRPAERSVAG